MKIIIIDKFNRIPLKIIKLGLSKAVILPKPIIEANNLEIDDIIDIMILANAKHTNKKKHLEG